MQPLHVTLPSLSRNQHGLLIRLPLSLMQFLLHLILLHLLLSFQILCLLHRVILLVKLHSLKVLSVHIYLILHPPQLFQVHNLINKIHKILAVLIKTRLPNLMYQRVIDHHILNINVTRLQLIESAL